MYTQEQRKAIYEIAKSGARIEVPARRATQVFVQLKLWSKPETKALRAYLNYITVNNRYHSESLGYIDLRTGEIVTDNRVAFDNNIVHFQIQVAA